VRVEGQDASGPLAIGQVEVLRVRAKRIHAVAPAGDRDALASADERHSSPRFQASATARRRRSTCTVMLSVAPSDPAGVWDSSSPPQ
jgi:hypothetical protein